MLAMAKIALVPLMIAGGAMLRVNWRDPLSACETELVTGNPVSARLATKHNGIGSQSCTHVEVKSGISLAVTPTVEGVYGDYNDTHMNVGMCAKGEHDDFNARMNTDLVHVVAIACCETPSGP